MGAPKSHSESALPPLTRSLTGPLLEELFQCQPQAATAAAPSPRRRHSVGGGSGDVGVSQGLGRRGRGLHTVGQKRHFCTKGSHKLEFKKKCRPSPEE